MVQGYSGHVTYNGGLDVARKVLKVDGIRGLYRGFGIFATGGIFAGATASCITMPLDTMKTRLQVMGHEKKHTVREVVKGLVADDDWKGLCRGPGPRFFTMSAWGTLMILSYEHLSGDSSFTLLLYSIIFVVVVIIMHNDEIAKTFMDLIIVNYCIGKFKPMSYPLFSYNHAQSI
ncbi:Mitochondrial substrate carrier family protein E [Camellia lanceoleosa]|uniref:Mitochondrial substrate carrier family protein E n=1 Tax=Camellia lanceoleosa TaxID=1840588 RepID=A0ACC0H1E3_9ERIC|nr:Mitochondrial substrate carrier family protein E [Camellia lanceoleosa]